MGDNETVIVGVVPTSGLSGKAVSWHRGHSCPGYAEDISLTRYSTTGSSEGLVLNGAALRKCTTYVYHHNKDNVGQCSPVPAIRVPRLHGTADGNFSVSAATHHRPLIP